MFQILSNFFQKKKIDLFAPIPLSACQVKRPYLLERENISNGTVFMIAVPYFTKSALTQNKNVSAYAISKDYHLYFSDLFSEIIPKLKEAYPLHRFCGFVDHSPINEIHAAALAGLGIIGKNQLLITKRYSSYVFLGEIITDIPIDAMPSEIRFCEDCGLCKSACPQDTTGECLSSVTQKKGLLNQAEQNLLTSHQTVWGCDLCQFVCPHTKRAICEQTIFTPIPFFEEDPLPHLTTQTIEQMSDLAFSQRAYAWRKKETILRNLKIMEEPDKKGS